MDGGMNGTRVPVARAQPTFREAEAIKCQKLVITVVFITLSEGIIRSQCAQVTSLNN